MSMDGRALMTTWPAAYSINALRGASFPKGVTVSDAEMAGLNIARDQFHSE
jgi:hypothetical protein